MRLPNEAAEGLPMGSKTLETPWADRCGRSLRLGGGPGGLRIGGLRIGGLGAIGRLGGAGGGRGFGRRARRGRAATGRCGARGARGGVRRGRALGGGGG